MPLYEYRCANGHLHEVLQNIADPPLTTCADCGKKMTRVFHPISVHFKGSGFYHTDYGKGKKSNEERPSSSPSEKDSS